jgi:hypothetical protein
MHGGNRQKQEKSSENKRKITHFQDHKASRNPRSKQAVMRAREEKTRNGLTGQSDQRKQPRLTKSSPVLRSDFRSTVTQIEKKA